MGVLARSFSYSIWWGLGAPEGRKEPIDSSTKYLFDQGGKHERQRRWFLLRFGNASSPMKRVSGDLGIDDLGSDFIANMWLLGECLDLEGHPATVGHPSYAKLGEIPTDSNGTSIQFYKESS